MSRRLTTTVLHVALAAIAFMLFLVIALVTIVQIRLRRDLGE